MRHTAPAFDMAVAMTRPASRRRPEIGVVFEHDGLVRQVREVLADETSPPKSYRVVPEDGEIIWLDRAAEPARIWREEPEAAIWRRLTATILGVLPIFQAARQLRSVRR